MNDQSLYRLLTERTRLIRSTFVRLPGGDSVTYQEFHQRCDRMADALRRRGVEPGQRLVVHVPKSLDALVIYLAALRIGALYVPLDPAYTEREVGLHMIDAAPSLYVGPQPMRRASTTLDDVLADAANAAGSSPDTSAVADEPATMLYTSGTTGQPKGAPATSAGLIHNTRDLAKTWNFTSDDVLLHVLPLFHVHGLFVAIHCVLFSGAEVILHDRFDADAAIADLPGSTVMMGVPTMYTRLLSADGLDRRSTETMRLFTSGSGPLPVTVHEAFNARTGHRIVERYGLTETGILTSNRIGSETPGSVGHPLPSVELRVAGDDGSSVVSGDVGEVQVRGIAVTSGYWGAQQASAAVTTHDGWFRTGDIGSLDDTGRLTLLGRGKDIVISGGLNVYPAEVEAAALRSDGLDEVAVIGVPHRDLGEAVVAVVAGREAPSAPLPGLASFKQPKRWIVVDELPRNTMGKVQKQALRERYRALFD